MAKKETPTRPSAPTIEIATTGRDVVHPVYGGVMTTRDDTLIARGGGRGLKIYDEIERDCHAYAVIQKRKLAVVAREWHVEPASEDPLDQRAAALVERQLAALAFDRICRDLLDALLKGYAVGECLWAVDGGEIVLADVRPREQRRFVFGGEGELRLLTPEARLAGIALPERKFIVHRHDAKDGNPHGLGLGTRLFWPVFFKRKGITFWLTFAEKFGTPTSVGTYPRGSTSAEVKTLMALLDAIASDTGVAVPEGMEIKLLEAQRSGSINTHETLCRYMDEQISEAVLGETLTTNIGGTGSRAAADTHNEVREELTKADADLLSDTLNATLARWITEFNLPGARPPRLWRDFAEAEDLEARARRDKTLCDMGLEPSPEYIAETYGPGWRRSGAARTQADFAEPQDVAQDSAAARRDAVDDLVDQLDAEAAPAVDAMIETLRGVIADSADMAEVERRLIETYPDLRADRLAEALRGALTVAALMGRAEIADG